MKGKFKINKKKLLGNVLTVALALFAFSPVLAAGRGSSALEDAANDIKSYYAGVKLILYAIGGVVGLIGGIRIYNKWQNGDQDVNKELMGWGGACIFLMIVPTFIDAFFKNA